MTDTLLETVTPLNEAILALAEKNAALEKRVAGAIKANAEVADINADLAIDNINLAAKAKRLEKGLRELSDPMVYEGVPIFHGNKQPWVIAKEALAEEEV